MMSLFQEALYFFTLSGLKDSTLLLKTWKCVFEFYVLHPFVDCWRVNMILR